MTLFLFISTMIIIYLMGSIAAVLLIWAMLNELTSELRARWKTYHYYVVALLWPFFVVWWVMAFFRRIQDM